MLEFQQMWIQCCDFPFTVGWMTEVHTVCKKHAPIIGKVIFEGPTPTWHNCGKESGLETEQKRFSAAAVTFSF